ncbi:MAG: cereblon family protein [Myxococcaceae bacterium]|nr:cereblon family protein [Myxococcaceae bacterium]MCI0672274.1 cereblon family protein [Myxococcaceae bacterium]
MELLPSLPLRALKETPPPTHGARPEEQPGAEQEAVGPERALHCAHCGHPITHEKHRTTVGGRHVHTRVNPHGFVYDFGCFSAAAGCITSGPPTQEDTWFPGHAWEFAGCAQCHTHLGWFFRGESAFFGLVLDRLRAGD